MPKLRKQRKRKVYKANINRKRLRNKLRNVGKVTCKTVKDAWERQKSVRKNFAEMGLAYDVNKLLSIPKLKDELKSRITSTTKWDSEIVEEPIKPTKKYVIENLEKEAKAPRPRKFQLPKGQVEWITYLMDKYGTDFKAMARDKRNYYQETWKQIRAKIKTFMGVPEQYAEYLEKRGLLESDNDVTITDFNMDSDSD